MRRWRTFWRALPVELRANAIGAGVLLALLCATFAPFLFYNLSLQDSAVETPSLFATGSRYPATATFQSFRELDPGAAAWQTEPDFAFEHNTLEFEKTPPLWNPYSGYGMPLAAGMASQPYFPLAWIPVVGHNARSWNLFVVLRLYLAGLFMFLFLRQFVTMLPALVGASSFMYAGYLLLYVTMPHISVEALIPALLYGVERLLRSPSFGTAGLLCVFLALCVLGGMPESTFLALSLGMLYAAVRFWGSAILRKNYRRILAFGTLSAVVSLGITAIQLLPFAEFVPNSFTLHIPGIGSVNDPFAPDLLGLYLAPLLHGPPDANIFAPGFSGDTGVRGFFGCAAAFFALLAAASQAEGLLRRKPPFDAPVVFFAVVAVGLIAKRFGGWPFSELANLPGFSVIIFTKYEEAIIACAVAILAAFGASLLCERRVSLAAITFATAVPLAVLTIAAGADQHLYHALAQRGIFYIGSLAAALAFLAVTCALALAARRGVVSPMKVAAIAVGLVVAEMNGSYIFPVYYVINGNAVDSNSALRGTDYVRFVQQHSAGNRFFGEGGILYPGWSEAFSIPDPRALDALYPQRYLPFVAAFFEGRLSETELTRFDGGNGIEFTSPMDRRFLDLSSVRYVGANVDLSREADSPFRVAFRQPGVTIYEYRSPLPRIAVYGHIVRASSADSALATIIDPAFNPRSEAIVESSAPELDALAAAPPSPVTAGRLEVYRTRYVRASVAARAKALVVLNDTAFPGWYASVDGRPAAILRANYLFRGIVVGPGRHVIEYRYEPSSFSIGALISVVSLVLLTLMFVASRLSPGRWTRRDLAEGSSEI